MHEAESNGEVHLHLASVPVKLLYILIGSPARVLEIPSTLHSVLFFFFFFLFFVSF